MSFIAILGAGALGGTLAHRLASRGRVGEVRLIDDQAGVAQGKALDIQQSGAVEGFATRVTSAGELEAAAGADAIVVADSSRGDEEHSGEAGLALVRRLAALDYRGAADVRRRTSTAAAGARRNRAPRGTAAAWSAALPARSNRRSGPSPRSRWTRPASKSRCAWSACRRMRRWSRGKSRPRSASRSPRCWLPTGLPPSPRGCHGCGLPVRSSSPRRRRASPRRWPTDRAGASPVSWRLRKGR